jgi:hypothetical protein
MRPLSRREKKTVRLGAAALAIYLLAFYGLRGWRFLEEKRAAFAELNLAMANLDASIAREESKTLRLERLKKSSRIELSSLNEKTAVGEALAAVQKAAQGCGLQVTTLKETAGRGAAKELATIQLEGVAATAAAMQFVHGLRSLGFPLIVDRLQLKTTGVKPGQVHLSLALAVLGFQAAKAAEKSGV